MKIDPEDQNPLEKILNLSDDWSDFDEEMLIELCRSVVEQKKKGHIILGRAALIQEKLKKHSTLRYLAQEAGVPEGTLASYKSVESILHGLDVPEDLSWFARQLIAKQDNPKEVLEHIAKEGLTNSMVTKLLYKKNGKHKEIECPRCHEKIQV